jgi:hypothetical protein
LPLISQPYRGHVVAVGGYAFGFRRSLFREVGGFDESYWRFYEEVDFHTAATHQGYANVTLAAPKVFHRIGATMAEVGTETNERNMATSRKRYLDKWWPIACGEPARGSYEPDAEDAIASRLLASRPDDRPKGFRADRAPEVAVAVDTSVEPLVYE